VGLDELGVWTDLRELLSHFSHRKRLRYLNNCPLVC
jgi:hypothetical protein